VFINLLFALLTGALIIMAFSTRTNWAIGWAQEHRDKERETSRAESYLQEKNDLEGLYKRELAIKDAKNETLKKENEQKDLERADALNKKNKAEQERDLAEATVKRTVAVNEAMKVEIKSLDERLADQQQTILKLGKQNKEYKDESIQAKTNLDTA